MGLRKLKPITPGTRHALLNDFAELTSDTPERSLLTARKRTGGRNNTGRVTSWHLGGGHRWHLRTVDFKRNKDGIPARVHSIEYDPGRTAFVALLHYADGEKRYVLAPLGLKVGDALSSGSEGVELKTGNCTRLRHVPVGMLVHGVELKPGSGAQMARSAGTYAVVAAKEGDHVHLQLPSGEIRKVLLDCRGTLGQLGNVDHKDIIYGKAGRRRWLGRRPIVRGSCQNPVSHPMGGGEGRRAGGRHPVSPWGFVAKGGKTRQRRKYSNSLIVRRPKGKKIG